MSHILGSALLLDLTHDALDQAEVRDQGFYGLQQDIKKGISIYEWPGTALPMKTRAVIHI